MAIYHQPDVLVFYFSKQFLANINEQRDVIQKSGILEKLEGLMSASPCMLRLLQSCTTLFEPMTVAHQAPLSMGFSRQEYWSGLRALLQGIFLTPEIKPMSLMRSPSRPTLPHKSNAVGSEKLLQ